MLIGYACICEELKEKGRFKTITVKQASKLEKIELIKKLKSIALHNLSNTLYILKYNVENDILMYRMTSSLIPLATYLEKNDLGNIIRNWIWYEDDEIKDICNKIKSYITENNIRISLHPDQFTILNSPNDKVVDNSVLNLKYHNAISELVANKTLVIHVGGVYNDKALALNRFIENFYKLSQDIQNKLCIENDDISYNLEEVISLCKVIKRPVVFDYHHDRCNPSKKDNRYYIEEVISTWHNTTPKMHLSSGREGIKDRRHSDYIQEKDFKDAMELTNGRFDIMIEAKKKEQAVLKLKK